MSFRCTSIPEFSRLKLHAFIENPYHRLKRASKSHTRCFHGVQAASAFASAKGATEGHLDIPALRIAMVMVLGRAVGEEEAESRLNALRERTFPRQPLVSECDTDKEAQPDKEQFFQ